MTVARHIADLHELVEKHCEGERPALVGHSWGAMLALAYAAAHPGRVIAVAMISSGTFDRAARDRMISIQAERTDDVLRLRFEQLTAEFPDPNDRLRAQGELFQKMDSHDLIRVDTEFGVIDERAHRETWQDMLRQQEEGVLRARQTASTLGDIDR
jgi:pimeloyl-ACP methyl ester carboxylesterase